jgi:hypothetical protein
MEGQFACAFLDRLHASMPGKGVSRQANSSHFARDALRDASASRVASIVRSLHRSRIVTGELSPR